MFYQNPVHLPEWTFDRKRIWTYFRLPEPQP